MHNIVTIFEGAPSMMRWAAVFFVVALAAAFFGFSGAISVAATVGKVVFFISLIVAVVSLVIGLIR